VPNVFVQVMRRGYQEGRRQLLPSGRASTNDLGECRLFGLAPARCYLSATADPDFLEPHEDKGNSVTVREGTAETVTLQLLPASAPQIR
jgi:hypothetical protein